MKTLMVVFFPFETRRVDGRQGPVARQVPALLCRAFADAGVEASLVSWVATRGDTDAHLLLEQPLPSALIATECAERGASRAVVGRIVLDDGQCDFAVGVLDPQTSEVLASAASAADRAPSLRDAVGELAGRLAEALAAGPITLELPRNDEAFVAWLTHLDNAALGPRGFRSGDIAPRWRWAIETLRHDGDFGPALRAARTLVDTLATEGHASEALSCALELAERTGDAHDWSRAVARLPDGARPLIERVIRLVRDVAVRPEVQLQLGVSALRAGMPEQAQELLDAASVDTAIGDRARAYLGVALAERGRRDEAMAVWKDVLERSSDSAAKAIAQSNLERAMSRST